MSFVEFEDVAYTYLTQPDNPALEGISFEIEQGEFVGISGPSDAGKSTVCRLIHSYIPNFFDGDLEGRVVVDGTDVTETSIGEMSQTVGLLFENPFDQLTEATMTVFEEVAFGLENAGVPRDEIVDRVYDVMETCGIEHLAGRNPSQLSGGQSQRLALASILAMEPELLVLDEPTSQLDPQGTEEVLRVIAEMERDHTVVIVSQDLQRIGPHLDRLLVLEDGTLRHDAPPREVLTTDGAEELVSIPDVVQIGRRLQENGGDGEIPLTTDAAVAALEPHVDATSSAATGSGEPAPDGDGVEPATDGDGDPPELDLEDVEFAYDDEIQALDGVSLTLDDGCICVIGQNGAGKSTFAKHLNGLLDPDSGVVRVRGRDTRGVNVAELAADVGLNFQNPDDQLFHNTVRKELTYGPRNLGYDEDRIETLVEDVIERMDLADIDDTNPYDIGLARRKQVAVASVLAMDTPVVVLDEPTAGQDTRGVDLLGDTVRDLVDEGIVVVVVTHDMDFVRDYADRVVALRQGEVLADGTPSNVFSDPDRLAKTDVHPPTVSQVARRLGLSPSVLTVDDLFEHVDVGG
jgi:energy-coupling factor transporter ATP-binding protein EcfA2